MCIPEPAMDNSYFLHTVRVNVDYAGQLLKDVHDAQIADQPHGLINHPAWCLGHLANTADFMAARFGRPGVVDPSWAKIFGMGSPAPVADVTKYPTKSALLAAMKDSHENFIAGLLSADDAKLAAPIEGWKHPWFPSHGALAQMIVLHDATHLGQISAWRRLLGYPHLF
jgi:hypothetical protein